MRTATSKTLYGYWNQIRGTRIAPRRFEVEPVSIARILPETFILECSGRSSAKFRLAGTFICDLFGREFRGRDITELWNGPDRSLIESALDSIVKCGSVAILDVNAMAPSGRSLELEIAMMPLVHSGDSINRIIGCLTGIEPILYARVPGDSISNLSIVRARQIWPDGRPHQVLPKSVLASALPPRIVTSSNRRFKVFEGGLSRYPSRDPQ